MPPRFLRKRVIDPSIALLARGITPKKVALAVACGIVDRQKGPFGFSLRWSCGIASEITSEAGSPAVHLRHKSTQLTQNSAHTDLMKCAMLSGV
jgi:hypothetical protein